MTIEAADIAEPVPVKQERRPRGKPRLLVSAIVVAIASFVLGLFCLLLTLLAGLGVAATAVNEPDPTGVVRTTAVMLLVLAMLAVFLIASGVGLLLRKPWGWWGATLMFGCLLVLALKMMTPILHINWEHPRAKAAAFNIVLQNGIPIVLSIPMLALLFGSRMRAAYGLKQDKLVRHRSAGRLRGPR